MMRKYFFSEKLGRNIIWVMLSGFFLKFNARENLFGQIVLPKDHFFFNLDDNKIDPNYINFNTLHYFFFDGSAEYLRDNRLKQIKKKLKIYYVGRLGKFWNNIENSSLLFTKNYKELEKDIIVAKKKFPIFFMKYYLKCFLTTIINFKKFKLTFQHILGKRKFVYYGYIKPTTFHLKFYQKKLGIKKYNFKLFFEETNNSSQLKDKINYLCYIKDDIFNLLGVKSYPYLNEFFLFMIRNIVCNILKKKKDFIIHDGLGGDHNFNAYEMLFGNQHIYLDLGSKVGFDKIYPRYALLKLFNRKIIRLNLRESTFYNRKTSASIELYSSINNFLKKLNIKL